MAETGEQEARRVATEARDRVRFLVPRSPLGWDRVAFLNLAFWTPGGGEILLSRSDDLVSWSAPE